MDEDSREVLKLIGVLILMIIMLVILIVGIATIGDYYEVKTYNRIHGTDYSFSEWFWGENVIKDYHEGTVENLNVDLNIKKGKNK